MYTYGRTGTHSLVNAFNKMLVTAGGKPYFGYVSHEMLSSTSCINLPWSMLTHDLTVVQFVLDCNRDNKNLWIVSLARQLETWVASNFFLPFGSAHTRQNSSFLPHAQTECQRLIDNGVVDLKNGTSLRTANSIGDWLVAQCESGQKSTGSSTTWHQRHCEKPEVFWAGLCTWFSDLARVLHVNATLPNGVPLFQYNATAGFALLRRGERGSTHNVLGLRLEDSSRWSEIIRTLLPGHGSFWLCNNVKFGTKKDSLHGNLYKSVQKNMGYQRKLRGALSMCDTFSTFYN